MKFLTLFAGLMLSWLPFQAQAENSTHIGGYTVHHNAFSTASLAPQVAKTYHLQRSRNRGMLNVSVIKNVAGTTGQPVEAEIEARATNLTGQSRAIPLREIREGNAIYYIGDFRVTDQETLHFELKIKPAGDTNTYSASLSQQFFTE